MGLGVELGGMTVAGDVVHSEESVSVEGTAQWHFRAASRPESVPITYCYNNGRVELCNFSSHELHCFTAWRLILQILPEDVENSCIE